MLLIREYCILIPIPERMHLSFSSAGRLNNTSGALESRGSTGYYWSASVGPPYMRSELQNPPYDRRIRYGAWSLESAYNSHNFRLSYQGFAQSIRCVKE